jgi:alcohol dehydrogenase/L-iditol 2-dehydrogenase
MSRRGLYNLDPTRRGYGAAVNGAMTKFVRVPARILHKVPDNLPLEIAALTEPCCVAYNAVVNNAHIRPGDRVVVFGPGPIGLLCGAMARLCGAEVAMVGLEQDRIRLDIAKNSYGCEPMTGTVTFSADERRDTSSRPAGGKGDSPLDWANAVDGLGADGAIDAAGVSATLRAAIDVVRPGGWISKVGWGPQPLDFSLDPLVQKNITLQGSFSHNWPIWERIIRLLSTGTLDIRPVIGGIWPLAQWKDAFEAMHSGKIAKAVLKP